jgi:hypothetical protein
MRYRFPLPVVLVCSLAACSDSPSSTAPAPATPRASAAEGRKPDRLDDTFVWDDASAICGFPVEVHVSGKAKLIVLSRDRATALSPALEATVTNLATGATITLSITGAFHETTQANGDVVVLGTGRNLLTDPVAGFVLAVGRFSWTVDAQGNLVQPLSGIGQLTNVCALLS